MSDEFDDCAAPSEVTEQAPAVSLSEARGGLDEPTDASAGGMVPRAELEPLVLVLLSICSCQSTRVGKVSLCWSL